MSDTTPSPNAKRRWYQFSMRTLLLVILVFVVGVGWIGIRMNRAKENRDRVAAVEEAVTAIEKLGGEVTSTYHEGRSQTWLEEVFDDPGGPEDPAVILLVTKVDLTATMVTDAGLRELTGLTSLQELYLGVTKVTDAGLKDLQKALPNCKIHQ